MVVFAVGLVDVLKDPEAGVSEVDHEAVVLVVVAALDIRAADLVGPLKVPLPVREVREAPPTAALAAVTMTDPTDTVEVGMVIAIGKCLAVTWNR